MDFIPKLTNNLLIKELSSHIAMNANLSFLKKSERQIPMMEWLVLELFTPHKIKKWNTTNVDDMLCINVTGMKTLNIPFG